MEWNAFQLTNKYFFIKLQDKITYFYLTKEWITAAQSETSDYKSKVTGSNLRAIKWIHKTLVIWEWDLFLVLCLDYFLKCVKSEILNLTRYRKYCKLCHNKNSKHHTYNLWWCLKRFLTAKLWSDVSLSHLSFCGSKSILVSFNN